MIGTFIIASLEGWPDIMYQAIDGDTPDIGPSKDNGPALSIYFAITLIKRIKPKNAKCIRF